jgi:excisionase family DNA binding protein
MHHRLQSGMRENPASHRRHGSRFEVDSLSNGTRTEKASVTSEELAPVHIHSPAAGHGTANAAPPHAATGGERDNTARHSAVLVGPRLPENALHDFERLIDSCEAAKLLGNIHVKTLQRYARHGRVPGYQIGGHWYFRASELDSWLQSRINLSCHPCRLQEKSDGT